MALITMMQAAEKRGLTKNQIQRIIYRRADAPKPVDKQANERRGGQKTKLYRDTEIFGFIDQIFQSEILKEEEVDFVGVGKILGKCTTHARHLFRNDCLRSPKPIRRTLIHQRAVFRKIDVIRYAAAYQGRNSEPKTRRQDAMERLRVAPVDNPHFDNKLAAKFVSRVDAIRAKFVSSSTDKPITYKVQTDGVWG